MRTKALGMQPIYLPIKFSRVIFSGTPCTIERMEKRKLGETFRASVSDNANALVKPKILGTPLENFERGKAMPKCVLRLILILSLNFEPIQKSGTARKKYTYTLKHSIYGITGKRYVIALSATKR